MAFNVKGTLEAVLSHVNSSAHVDRAQIGDYSQPPLTESIAASIQMTSMATNLIFGDGGTRETHTIQLRLLKPWLNQPSIETEQSLAIAAADILSNLEGDADAEGTVMSLDVAGMEGASVTIRWGHIVINQTAYRVAEMALPFIVDDSATVTA